MQKISDFIKAPEESKRSFADFQRGDTVTKRFEGIGCVSPTLYGAIDPSATAHATKMKGWIDTFGDHYLCQLGCKKFASKKLDGIIEFIRKEIKKWYEPKKK